MDDPAEGPVATKAKDDGSDDMRRAAKILARVPNGADYGLLSHRLGSSLSATAISLMVLIASAFSSRPRTPEA